MQKKIKNKKNDINIKDLGYHKFYTTYNELCIHQSNNI